MDCPRCHLINPPGTWSCDCGYDFRDGSFSSAKALKDPGVQAFADKRARTLPAILLPVACVAGFWLQNTVYSSAQGTSGFEPKIPFFICVLVWISTVTLLFGRALFGQQSQGWHGIVLLLFGGIIGFVDGFLYWWVFGGVLGLFSGMMIGGLVFAWRHRP